MQQHHQCGSFVGVFVFVVFALVFGVDGDTVSAVFVVVARFVLVFVVVVVDTSSSVFCGCLFCLGCC